MRFNSFHSIDASPNINPQLVTVGGFSFPTDFVLLRKDSCFRSPLPNYSMHLLALRRDVFEPSPSMAIRSGCISPASRCKPLKKSANTLPFAQSTTCQRASPTQPKKQNEINRNWLETTFQAAARTIRVMFHTVFERTAS